MTKAELREKYKTLRLGIPAEKKAAAEEKICRHLAESKEFKNAKTILIYAPVRAEIDLLPLIEVARKHHKNVAFPISNPKLGTMKFYILERGEKLSPGAFGIPEPPMEAPLCVPDKRTLCLVPGLAFDQNGNRLGYGGGYYDRFLSDFPGTTVGVTYEETFLSGLPVTATDVPVMATVSECGIRRKQSSSGKLVLSKSVIPAPRKAIEAPLEDVGPVRPLHYPPLLVLVSFALLLLSRLIEDGLTNRGGIYLSVILLQMLIFLIPATLYVRLQGDSFTERIRLRPIEPNQIWFCFCMFVTMVTGSLLSSVLTGGIADLGSSFTLYNTFVARTDGSPWETIYIILAYALLPAFCEELMFRSVLCAEYEHAGATTAIFASAVYFAMLHFSLPLFLSYLLLGVILGRTLYTTRSVLSSMILHFAYNLFCLFGQPFLSAFYMETGSTAIFLFCLVVLFLLFSAFAAGEARKIYHLYAKRKIPANYRHTSSLSDLFKSFRVFLSPVTLVCLLFWLVFVIF